MSFLNTSINVNSLPESDSYELLPAGWYNGIIEESELKTTNAGTGQYIKLKIKLDNNRSVFTNLNIANPNEIAQNIGLADLRKIMEAGQVVDLQDTDQLVGIGMSFKIAIKPAQGNYEASNEVKGYKSLSSAAAPAMPVIAKAAPAQPAPVAQAPAVDLDEDLPF